VVFDRQPVLASELILLRPLVSSDFDALYCIGSDPLLWEQHPSRNRAEEPVFRRWFTEALASEGALVVVDRTADEVIGTSRYVLRSQDEVEVGWTFLARSHWGGRYNGELKRLMLEHAFRSVKTVLFAVHSDNIRSQRAIERLGAVPCGNEPDAHGRGHNLVFALTKFDENTR
jgi:RimJ/RimL family protein N-acetyltransferase